MARKFTPPVDCMAPANVCPVCKSTPVTFTLSERPGDFWRCSNETHCLVGAIQIANANKGRALPAKWRSDATH